MSIKPKFIESLKIGSNQKRESAIAYPVSSSNGRGPSKPGSSSTFEPSWDDKLTKSRRTIRKIMLKLKQITEIVFILETVGDNFRKRKNVWIYKLFSYKLSNKSEINRIWDSKNPIQKDKNDVPNSYCFVCC